MFGVQPSVLVAAPSKGFKTVADLVAAAKAKPGELNFASAGIGSASHIAGERFRLAAGIDVQHVPYRGPNRSFRRRHHRARGFLFPADRAGGAVDRAKARCGARGIDAEAGAAAARRADHRRSRLSGRRPICSGAASRRRRKRRATSSTSCMTTVQKALDMPAVREKLAQLRRAADADDAGTIRKILRRRHRRHGQARQGRPYRADRLSDATAASRI